MRGIFRAMPLAIELDEQEKANLIYKKYHAVVEAFKQTSYLFQTPKTQQDNENGL
jgi:hypothetical protein